MLLRAMVSVASIAALLVQSPQDLSAQVNQRAEPQLKLKVEDRIAYAKSRPLRELPKPNPNRPFWTDPGERGGGPTGNNNPQNFDGALQTAVAAVGMPAPLFTFEGPSNQDNFNTFGFRVNPPDPVGDVGKDQYVAMINLVYSVYSKTGELLGGPFDTGTLWQDFPIEDCTDPSGDPIVFYDEIANRWVLTQFTTRDHTPDQFYICMAVSATPDALGEYHLHAFSTGNAFPDYPKYGLWRDAYVFTTREFPETGGEQIGIYAVKRTEMLGGSAPPRMVHFTLTGPPNLVGDGLLPADIDGKRLPPPDSPIPIVGAQDDDAFDGATFDALNVFHLKVKWSKREQSTFTLAKQVPISEYDTNFPCTPAGSRDCLEQPPPATNILDKLDILSYRQRPTHRLQYRNFGTHESLVTNQAVEARPNVAGIRWWELRNPADPVLYQEGTWSPDNVHRWMGSAAMDRDGNLALGYSVVNATTFPGIRYAGRLAGDPLGQLTQGEAELQTGSGVQRTTNSRWGDYTSLNLDPNDDCTFYYINEYYTAASQATSTAGWLTRIGAFKFPSCKPGN
jgi:hypothetical protein